MNHASSDPRAFATVAESPALAPLYRLAEASLSAATQQDADACDARIAESLASLLQAAAGTRLAELFAAAPSADVYRHLWRLTAERERAASPGLVRLFAIPVIVVAGIESPSAPAEMLDGVLADPRALSALLIEHGALAGNQTLALANTLVGADRLDFAHLPELLAWRALPAGGEAHALPPAPINVVAGGEAVHLRFLVGTALAGPEADLFRDAGVGRWGMPLAQALSRALAVPGVSVLALPRPAQPLVTAAWQGKLAQREVSAQLFASNAIRKLRAGVGEPSAVISVHRIDGGDGEVRLSLSSPFDPRQAEGFRAPLLPLDRVEDVVQMLRTLLADCRVEDVRREPGVHPDRDPGTGMTLLFKSSAKGVRDDGG